MHNRLVPALASAALIAAAAALPAPTAAADLDCTPSIAQSSVHFTPKKSVLTSKGSTDITVTATLTAPCAESNATDLSTSIFVTPVDFEHERDWDVSSNVMPAGNHTFTLFTVLHLKAAGIDNADAGSWDGIVGVQDTDDPGEYGLPTNSDPVSFSIRRAAKVTANASPEPVKKGKTVTVRGQLTRANWESGKDRTYGQQLVQLQFRTKSGSYHTVKTTHSTKTGALKVAVKAAKDGYYRFVFAGKSTTAGAKSSGDYVNVT